MKREKVAELYADTFEYGFMVDGTFLAGEVHIDNEEGMWICEIYGINGDDFDGCGFGDDFREAVNEAMRDSGLNFDAGEEDDLISHIEFMMSEQHFGGIASNKKRAFEYDAEEYVSRVPWNQCIIATLFYKDLWSYDIYLKDGTWITSTYDGFTTEEDAIDDAIDRIERAGFENVSNGVIAKRAGRPNKWDCIYLGRSADAPDDVIAGIMMDWYYKSKEYGDVGSCVLGAGFQFEYKGKWYFMPPQGPWQGSCSWEASKDDIRQQLEAAGATNITYDWGWMD